MSATRLCKAFSTDLHNELAERNLSGHGVPHVLAELGDDFRVRFRVKLVPIVGEETFESLLRRSEISLRIQEQHATSAPNKSISQNG